MLFRLTKSLLAATVALSAVAASCGEPPATDHDDPATTSSEVTSVERLPLKEIMQGLDRDLATLAHGIWVEDQQVIQEAARRIADHPKVTPEQMVAIKKALDSDFPSFVRFDKDVHEAAAGLADATGSTDSTMVISDVFDDYLRIQQGCLSCHEAFRGRVFDALNL